MSPTYITTSILKSFPVLLVPSAYVEFWLIWKSVLGACV